MLHDEAAQRRHHIVAARVVHYGAATLCVRFRCVIFLWGRLCVGLPFGNCLRRPHRQLVLVFIDAAVD